ncbi:hypothetical protein GQ43DRAFT_132321 [Delitschia confertaspora ATCC 74209]|uniref:Fork-head domain-containing protein n=1 Tax=Delitschia confertaspora ATCC 74209 TaxID=1513339 RepID=A0A9P4JGR2_9PLEO|nr:hypothetical protein GQ43DRAFT_132321 [Delitschia confertaspora ATCC 74209]
MTTAGQIRKEAMTVRAARSISPPPLKRRRSSLNDFTPTSLDGAKVRLSASPVHALLSVPFTVPSPLRKNKQSQHQSFAATTPNHSTPTIIYPRIQDDEQISISSAMTCSDLPKCRECKAAATSWNPLVQCPSCPRRFHESCQLPKPEDMQDWSPWQCARCLNKGRKLPKPPIHTAKFLATQPSPRSRTESAPSVILVPDEKHVGNSRPYRAKQAIKNPLIRPNTTASHPQPNLANRGNLLGYEKSSNYNELVTNARNPQYVLCTMCKEKKLLAPGSSEPTTCFHCRHQRAGLEEIEWFTPFMSVMSIPETPTPAVMVKMNTSLMHEDAPIPHLSVPSTLRASLQTGHRAPLVMDKLRYLPSTSNEASSSEVATASSCADPGNMPAAFPFHSENEDRSVVKDGAASKDKEPDAEPPPRLKRTSLIVKLIADIRNLSPQERNDMLHDGNSEPQLSGLYFTYRQLIAMALLTVQDSSITAAAIKDWVAKTFSKYRKGQGSWEINISSILCTCNDFRKERIPGEKSLWTFENSCARTQLSKELGLLLGEVSLSRLLSATPSADALPNDHPNGGANTIGRAGNHDPDDLNQKPAVANRELDLPSFEAGEVEWSGARTGSLSKQKDGKDKSYNRGLISMQKSECDMALKVPFEMVVRGPLEEDEISFRNFREAFPEYTTELTPEEREKKIAQIKKRPSRKATFGKRPAFARIFRSNPREELRRPYIDIHREGDTRSP